MSTREREQACGLRLKNVGGWYPFWGESVNSAEREQVLRRTGNLEEAAR